MQSNPSSIAFRPASIDDLDALTAIKQPSVLHRDRLRDASENTFLYLVIERDQQVVGHALLVFHRPPTWPDAFSTDHLPQIVDLNIAPAWRGQGLGTVFLQKLEAIVFHRGYDRLYLCVDPIDNPRAHALYLRLGYQPQQAVPYRDHWEFTDSDGNLHSGDEWALDMVKTNLKSL